MRTMLALLAALAAAPASAAAAPAPGIVHDPPPASVPDPGRWIIPRREIVVYRPGVRPATIASVARAGGGGVIASIPALDAVVVSTGAPGHGDAVAAMASMRGVEQVEPDVRLVLDDADCTLTSACVVPNDPGFADQWYLENDRATVEPPGGGTLGDDIDAPLGWALDRGSSSVRIAIVDTGIDPSQPDVSARVVASTTIAANHGDTADRIGHGTAVAGVAAAIPNNHIGIAGVAYNASLVNVKVFADSSGGDSAACSAVASGIVAAVHARARVINVSSGGPMPCPLLEQAAALAWSRGDVVVAAAGNAGTTAPIYPAAYDDVVSVGATNAFDRPASFSSRGSSWVDLSAPGVNILSTAPTYANRLGPTDLGLDSGTSVAAPMVSGAAALLFARGLTNRQVVARLFTYARDVPGTGHDWRYGMLDVCNAIAAGAPLCELTSNVPGSSPAPVTPPTTPPAASGPAPTAGTYAGTTSQGLPLHLVVGAGNELDSLAVALSVPCGAGTLTFAPTLVTSSSPLALTAGVPWGFSGQWTDAPGVTYSVSGTFAAPGAASGTLEAVDTAGGDGRCTSGPVSWSAGG